MFRDLDEKFNIELEIEGEVVLTREITPCKYDMFKAMLKRKALRDYKGKEWAIYVHRKRLHRTRSHLSVINQTYNI